MKIYLAARFSLRKEMKEHKIELENMGHTVTSRWLIQENLITDEDLSEARSDKAIQWLSSTYAKDDLDDIVEADVLILFTEEQRIASRGGRMVEFGYALGLGKEVWIIGPDENVFSTLPEVLRYENWEMLLDTRHWKWYNNVRCSGANLLTGSTKRSMSY